MNATDLTITLLSCAFFMGLVAYVSYLKTRGQANSREGYFLAGRSLSGIFIAGSLLLTNLSAEQLVGLNGSAYGSNLSSMAWEVTAGLAIVIMALVFLPKYLKGAFTTLPEFLNTRFDDDVRRLSVILFMLGYGLITIPSVLYSGSIAVLRLFNVPDLLGVGYSSGLIITILIIGIIGALYAIFGGLKAVAVSDTINGIGLLIIGLLIPVLGLIALGDGNFFQGLETLTTTKTEKLNAVGAATDPLPFGTIFTGMIFANLFYWGTNQYVIQRTLGAASLKEGQKGVILSGYYKVLVPFMMMIPGTIAFHLYGPGLATIDLAYPTLVKDLLPTFMAGFFLAVLLGAVFSSFNSLLNSAATMFVLDVYEPLRPGKLSEVQVIKVAKIASVVIAVLSFVVSPLLQYAPEGLWQIIRIFTGFYNIPIITVVLVGLFFKRVPALAAKVSIVFHVIAYALLRFVIEVDIHFVHVYAILFAIEFALMLLIGYWKPNQKVWTLAKNDEVDMTPWKYAYAASIWLIAAIVILYLTFSKIGLVDGIGANYFLTSGAVVVLAGIGSWWSVRKDQQT
ncbi:MAG: solute:sodium symporter family transporter [Cytophagales bacterium]|nr:solute:sodium symporter family transporter [Cytophagales bacterium]